MAGRIVGSVDAKLQLDYSQFDKGLGAVKASLTALTESLAKFNKAGTAEGLIKLSENLKKMSSSTTDTKKNIENFSASLEKGNKVNESYQATLKALGTTFETTGQGVQSYVTAMNRQMQTLTRSQKNLGNVGTGYNKYLSMTGEFTRQKRAMDNVSAGLKLLEQQEASFWSSLNKTTREVQRNNQMFNRLDSELLQISKSMKLAQSSFTNNSIANGLKLLDQAIRGTNSSLNTHIRKANETRKSYMQLHSELLQVSKAMKLTQASYSSQVTNGMGLLQSTLTGNNSMNNAVIREVEAQRALMNKFNKIPTSLGAGYSQYLGQVNNVKASMKGLEQSVTSVGTATQNTASKTQGLTGKLGNLISVSSRLKSIFTMVSSLFVWQFANSLFQATSETIKARSEMDSLFAQLKLGSSEINQMNNALDNTINRFQKMNRYSIGETIASLGVEFNLTADQMEKALPILSMVQSEYLRAGRTTEEATLAVKDIMQGELLRLSRETGVGKGELTAAGWTGQVVTNEDIDSLLEALNKVGTARHWDVFASKANSLNDILLITQNRFSEFASELVDKITPDIVGGFNIVVTSLEMIGKVLGDISGLFGNFNFLDNLGIKFITLGSAVSIATIALISHRTGAGLLQIAQMGLRRSILATIFSLNAETVANNGVLASLLAKITGYKAEEIALVGSKKVLLAKILGLNLEIVAQTNLRTAIYAKVMSVEVETAKTAVANMTTRKFIATLMAEKVALIATSVVLIAVTAILVSYAMTVQDACNKNKAFNTVLSEGDNYIKDASKKVQNYKDQIARLNERLNDTSKSEKELSNIRAELTHSTNLLKTAEKERQVTEETVQMVRSRKAKADQSMTDAQLLMQSKLKQSYIDLGLSASEADYQVSNFYLNAQEGMKNYYESAQLYNKRMEQLPIISGRYSSKLEEEGYSDGEIVPKKGKRESLLSDRAEYERQMNNSTDVIEAGRAWANLTYTNIKIGWGDFWDSADKGDWGEAIAKYCKGIFHFLDDTLFGGFFGDLASSLNKNGGKLIGNFFRDFDILGAISEGLSQSLSKGNLGFITGLFEKLLGSNAGNTFTELGKAFIRLGIVKPIRDAWNNLVSNFWGTIFGSDGNDSGSNVASANINGADIAKNINADNSDTNWAKELLDTIVFQPIRDAWNNFINDPLGFLNLQPFDIGSFIKSLITGQGTAEQEASTQGSNIGGFFGTALQTSIMNIPVVGSVLSMLGLVDSANPTANSKGFNLGNNYTQGVNKGISPMSTIMSNELAEVEGALVAKELVFFAKGAKLGKAITDGFNSTNAIDHNSPGRMARLIIAENDEIENALTSAVPSMYSAGEQVGSAIVMGMSNSQGNGLGLSFDTGSVEAYVNNISNAMAVTQSTANGATNTFQGMDSRATAAFGNMDTTITGTFDNISQNTTSNYNKMANVTKLQLGNMQTQTTRNIDAIRTSWTGMQTALIASAENIRSQTSQKIGHLENNMARFWRKIQNPANLIAGVAGGLPVGRGRNSGHSGVRSSVARVIAPTGMYAGGAGVSKSMYPKRHSNDSPDNHLWETLSCMLNGETCYAGGWDFNWTPEIMRQVKNWRTHFGAIYDSKLRVGSFENSDFPVRGDTDIFRKYVLDAIGRTSYEFYYNSKYGSALNAWNAGHFNCYDGALVVMALASAFGLSSTMRHGHWNGIPHVWAYVQGVGDVDATAIQGGYGLTSPKVSGGKPTGAWKRWASGDTTNNSNKTEININIDLSGSTVSDKNIGEDIGDMIVNKLVEMKGVNPATGL